MMAFIVILLLSFFLHSKSVPLEATAFSTSSSSTSPPLSPEAQRLTVHNDTPGFYNLEMKVIEEGKSFVVDQLTAFHLRKPLLCATFMNISNPQSRHLLHVNIRKMNHQCDWFILFYAGAIEDTRICQHSHFRRNIIHCNFTQTDRGNMTMIPKPFLYVELSAFISNYQYVFLLDEDISLVTFDIVRYQRIHKCAFIPNPPPLISQGLVAEATQFYQYLFYGAWQQHPNYSEIVMSETVFIEQQAPYLNALFLQWFLVYVVKPTLWLVKETESAWGTDSTWCGAAYLYAKEILGYDMKTYVPCGLVINSPPYHHNDGRTIRAQRTKTEYFKIRGNEMREYYHSSFPTWFHSGHHKENHTNPLRLDNHLLRSYSLPETCRYYGEGTKPLMEVFD